MDPRVKPWVLVVVGAVLPLALGASLGSLTTSEGDGTWAHPMPPTAFLVLSVGLALSHLLVLLAYVHLARVTDGPAAALARLGGVGTVLLVVCELWSGLLARTDLDAAVLDGLQGAYAVSAVLVVVGTAGAGLVLRRSGSPYAWPLLVNGLVLAVATVVRQVGSDGLGIAVLTVWSLLYVWVAVVMRRPATGALSPARSAPAGRRR